MGVLDRFEKGVEHAMSSAFGLVGSKSLKPIDFVRLLQKKIDEQVMTVSRERDVAPNRYVLSLSTPDFDTIETWGPEAFADELAENLTEYAETQHYSFPGPVSVIFEENINLEQGNIEVDTQMVRGTMTPSQEAQPSQTQPIIDINGKHYVLDKPVTILGRGVDADVVIDDPGVSRKHLELRVTPQGTIATDLGSTNGLYVEGHQVPAATLMDGNTLTIGRTRIMYWDYTGEE